ncbi:SRPBCC family protein [Pseudonocardia sp. KRD291]|uniref:SRPBCC family protein n=1 Tax=Pseudonocardia sp. KRD291 TaxID=2792007 RepID=UPI001C49F218|nr:SRPBCC family protein [Pseudonocardia sp. KRD291]MBW0102211.1 SRPBCC family protein [Pseudonocardia sp. KRD291]
MIDIITELDEVRRRVHAGERGDQVAVRLERTYRAGVEDVWDALTDRGRLARWFLPVSGDLKVGGHFATEGNADGEVLRCDRPSTLVVTWGGPESVVTVELAADGAESTVLTLDHSVTATPVPDAGGALYVGPGWDGAFLALGLHLRGTDLGDPAQFQNSPEVLEYNVGLVQAWEATLRESGMATEEQTQAAVAVATAQFTTLP